MVTTPLAEVVPMVAPSAILFAVNETAIAAETLLSSVNVAPVEVIDTVPALEVMLALEPEDVVMFPDPETEMFPNACIGPVGATVVPPLIVRVPAELSVPEPL